MTNAVTRHPSRIGNNGRVKIIDVHTHAFPDAVAAKAIPKLAKEADWTACGTGTVASLLESMDAAGVSVSVICSIATRPEQVQPIFDWSRQVRSERIVPLPSLHPKTPNVPEWVERFTGAGFPGIKLHPMYQQFTLDDACMDEIYSACARCGLFVEIHCGYDIAFAGDESADPIRVRRVLDRHPDLKLVATHLGGWKRWEQVREHLLGSPAWLETSFSMEFMPHELLAEMISRHDPARVLFGTDWPWARQDRELDSLRRLPLPPEQIDRMLWANPAALLGIKDQGS